MSVECKSIECCIAYDKFLGDLSGFSFVGGDYPGGALNGNPESTFVIDCPEGIVCETGTYPKVVTIPENTVQSPYPPDNDGGPIYLRVPCCDGSVVTRVLPGSTSGAEVNATLAVMLSECSQTCAENNVNTAAVETTYSSSEQDVTCGGLLFQSAPGGLLVLNADKTATLPAGTHTSTLSQADADAQATAYIASQLQTYYDAGGACGYWNTAQQKCPPDGPTAAALTFFSAVSQAQADQDALDSLPECACNADIDALTWSKTSGSGTASGSGADISWSCASNGVVLTSSTWDSTPAGVTCTFNATYTTTGTTRLQLGRSGGAAGSLYDSGLQGAGTYDISETIIIPSSVNQLLFLTVTAGGGGTSSIGTARIGPP